MSFESQSDIYLGQTELVHRLVKYFDSLDYKYKEVDYGVNNPFLLPYTGNLNLKYLYKYLSYNDEFVNELEKHARWKQLIY